MRFMILDRHRAVAVHLDDVTPEEVAQAMRKTGSREVR